MLLQWRRSGMTFVLLSLLVLVTIFNFCVIIELGRRLRHDTVKRTYTWNGTDYPTTLPIHLTNTLHYQYTEHVDYFALSEDPKSVAAWDTLELPGYGFVNLGPEKRRFGVSMFHQLHCLINIRVSLHNGTHHPHITHCLNYLMQMVLCAADISLEPDEFPTVLISGSPKTAISEATHTCRDWTTVFKHMEELYWS